MTTTIDKPISEMNTVELGVAYGKVIYNSTIDTPIEEMAQQIAQIFRRYRELHGSYPLFII